MSTKLSLLSRAAAVAGILAFALPAMAAEASKPVAPTVTTPSAAAAANTTSKQISGEAKTTSPKIVHAKKHVTKPVHTVAASTRSSAAPVVKPVTPAAPATTDAVKTGTPAK
jgi:hypothetical protein